MKNAVTIFGLLFIFFACGNPSNEKPNFEGDLYYTWLKLGSFYNVPDSFYQKYVDLRDSISIEELKKDDSTGTAHIELLEKNDLVKSPFVYVKTDTDSIFIVYMTPDVYEPITEFSYQNLVENKQRVRLRLVTERLSEKLRICKKVVSIEKLSGETLQNETKFKIEDYE